MLEYFFKMKNRLYFLFRRELSLSVFSCDFLFSQTYFFWPHCLLFTFPEYFHVALLVLLSFWKAISFLSMLLLPSNVNYSTFISTLQKLHPSIQ